jgi:hypothetical protein
MMWSSFFFSPTIGYSFPLKSLNGMSLKAISASRQQQLLLFKESNIPSCLPFLVNNACPRRKLTRHPTVSPTPNCSAYGWPVFCDAKEWPSSPWYPQEPGSQPGARDVDASLLAKPMAMGGVLDLVSTRALDSSRTNSLNLIGPATQNRNLKVIHPARRGHVMIRSDGAGFVIRRRPARVPDLVSIPQNF